MASVLKKTKTKLLLTLGLMHLLVLRKGLLGILTEMNTRNRREMELGMRPTVPRKLVGSSSLTISVETWKWMRTSLEEILLVTEYLLRSTKENLSQLKKI